MFGCGIVGSHQSVVEIWLGEVLASNVKTEVFTCLLTRFLRKNCPIPPKFQK
jgi:hypothetical protein